MPAVVIDRVHPWHMNMVAGHQCSSVPLDCSLLFSLFKKKRLPSMHPKPSSYASFKPHLRPYTPFKGTKTLFHLCHHEPFSIYCVLGRSEALAVHPTPSSPSRIKTTGTYIHWPLSLQKDSYSCISKAQSDSVREHLSKFHVSKDKPVQESTMVPAAPTCLLSHQIEGTSA